MGMRTTGLTLVELLVVISILALLLALLFPVFAGVREHAKATVCSARLKDLTTTLLTYESQRSSFPCGFDGLKKEPPPGGYAGNPTMDPAGWWWFDFAGVVRGVSSRDEKTLTCPSKRLDTPRLGRNSLCGNYGANWSVCKSARGFGVYGREFAGSPLCSTDVLRPLETALLMDSGYSLICWWHATAEPPEQLGHSIQDTAYVPGLVEVNEERELWPGQMRDAKGGRHPNKTVNIGFVDGHVARRKASDLLVEKVGEDDYDYSPLWGPK
jgi:prepilin-type processing-associated H-X9-DG protein/prepilin-type N-terminal cleavage/methylation domain-containing protein